MRSLKNFALAIVAVAGFLALQGLFDYQDKVFADRAAYRQWVGTACLPSAPGQRAISRVDAGLLHCAVYDNTGYGRAATLAAASTMEIPK